MVMKAQQICEDKSGRWVTTHAGTKGKCFDVQQFNEQLNTLLKDNPHQYWTRQLIGQTDPQAQIYRFNGMDVNLLKKEQFDAWFNEEMQEAPRQINDWKIYFDEWAEKRMNTLVSQKINLKKFATAKPSYASDKISMSVREYGEIDEQTSND